MIKIIVAANSLGYIGKDNALMYKNKADMANFKNLTTSQGNTILMGRKTFESIGSKPLPDRINIVITSDPIKFINDTETTIVDKGIVNVLDGKGYTDYLKKHQHTEEVSWVIGGTSVIDEAMECASEVYYTIFDALDVGDVKLPADFAQKMFNYFTLKTGTDLPVKNEGETAGILHHFVRA